MKDSMKLLITLKCIIMGVLIMVSSCEQNQMPEKLVSLLESNKSDTLKELEKQPPETVKLIESHPTKPDIIKPLHNTPKPKPQDTTATSHKTPLQAPVFSESFLNAVQNWNRIPKSAFPTKAVIIYNSVNVSAKTSSGVVIARSVLSAGTKVQVLAANGGSLTVSPETSTKMLGTIDISNTDFKQCLAYKYELGLRIIKEKQISEKIAQSKKISKGKKAPLPSPSPTPKSRSLEIPDPLDFGHGRFCICKDCRKKRLANTGSLKTGFGLEP